jgi:hypothetical protein
LFLVFCNDSVDCWLIVLSGTLVTTLSSNPDYFPQEAVIPSPPVPFTPEETCYLTNAYQRTRTIHACCVSGRGESVFALSRRAARPFWGGRGLVGPVGFQQTGVFGGVRIGTPEECTNLETKAEPQQIVAQGLLSCLQYPVPYISRLQRI